MDYRKAHLELFIEKGTIFRIKQGGHAIKGESRFSKSQTRPYLQYLIRMKMNQFLLDKVIDMSNTKTLNIQPDSLDENEKIFMNLAVQDSIIEIKDKTIILTAKGSAYLEFLIKNKTNSIRVGLK